ncbi:MAG TPA: Na+/H+ antiporter NhaA [Geminicoccaceae bacterium]
MAKKAAGSKPLPTAVATRLLTPVQEFIRTESASGVLLIAAAALAFAWANSPWAVRYFAILDIPVGVGFGAWSLEKPLLLWVNDLLMAVFFFVIGLEIKREILVGELAGWRRASLPAAGALGGMLVPALIYVAFNPGEPALRGWGVPMATDIAFALGVLALLGERVPLSLKVFLLALAIVDDLGAVLVIALFYTAELNGTSLLISLLVWGGALAYGRADGTKPLAFALLGLVMWYFMLKSGIHATIAGVLMALAVPLRHRLSAQELQQELRSVSRGRGEFEQVEMMLEHLDGVLNRAHSPLHNIEHALAPYVAFVVMPVFAFFNAGVAVGGSEGGLISAVSLGAFVGLLIGKPVGIAGFVFLAVISGVTRLPPGATWPAVAGIGLLAGIGFTMSLFIANLAFAEPALLAQAKIGVLAASLVASLTGLAFLSRALPQRPARVTAVARP